MEMLKRRPGNIMLFKKIDKTLQIVKTVILNSRFLVGPEYLLLDRNRFIQHNEIERVKG